MMLSLNGPMKQMRLRKTGIPAEGTVIDTDHAPARNFRDNRGTRGWDNGGWCAVYSYTLADGRIIRSTMTELSQWKKSKEEIVMGEKVPLVYHPMDPLKIHRADMPVFDGGDIFFFIVSFFMIAVAIPFWPKSAAVGIVVVAAYFALRSGRFAKDEAK
jgi:hypothetical protein